MPLNLFELKTRLEALFAAPPPTREQCAQTWADAVQAYAVAILPASTTVTAAAAALSPALASAFATPLAGAGIDAAFAAFAATVGGGMLGYTPVPPVTPLGTALQFSGPKPATHAAAASQIGDLIHAWLTTGVSTLVAPPYTPQTWS